MSWNCMQLASFHVTNEITLTCVQLLLSACQVSMSTIRREYLFICKVLFLFFFRSKLWPPNKTRLKQFPFSKYRAAIDRHLCNALWTLIRISVDRVMLRNVLHYRRGLDRERQLVRSTSWMYSNNFFICDSKQWLFTLCFCDIMLYVTKRKHKTKCQGISPI